MKNCVHLLLVSIALLTFELDDLAFSSIPSSNDDDANNF